ncbi:jg27113, partial [Pararge aegeria aegeria]
MWKRFSSDGRGSTYIDEILKSRRDHDPCNWVEISTNPKYYR